MKTSQLFGLAFDDGDEPTSWFGVDDATSQLFGSAFDMRSGCHSPEMAELQVGITFDWNIRFKWFLWRWNRNEKCHLVETGFLGYIAVTKSCLGNDEGIDPGLSVRHPLVSALDLTLSYRLYSLNVVCIFNIDLREILWYNNCPPKSSFMNIKQALNIATLSRSTRSSEFLFIDS